MKQFTSIEDCCSCLEFYLKREVLFNCGYDEGSCGGGPDTFLALSL